MQADNCRLDVEGGPRGVLRRPMHVGLHHTIMLVLVGVPRFALYLSGVSPPVKFEIKSNVNVFGAVYFYW